MYLAAFGVRATPSARERRVLLRDWFDTSVLSEESQMRFHGALSRRKSVSEGFAKGGSATDRTRSPLTLSQPRSRIWLQASDHVITARPALTAGSAPAAHDAPELREPRRDLALVAVLGRFVVHRAAQLGGQVLLRHHADRVVVRIDVALAVAEPLRARVVGVAEVLGHSARAALAHVGDRAVDAEVGGVRLRR